MVTWMEKQTAVQKLEKGGIVDPNDLIEAARNPKHPCHGDFTWDTTQAASERWRDQARAIIRRCTFEVQHDEVSFNVVRYVSDGKSEDAVFDSLPKMRKASSVSNVLKSELANLLGVASRVRGIALAKRSIVGDKIVNSLGLVCDTLEEIEQSL